MLYLSSTSPVQALGLHTKREFTLSIKGPKIRRPKIGILSAVMHALAVALLFWASCAVATEHVLLISVDGMHTSDLQQWVDTNPSSYLARLSRNGITYSSASIDGITDSFPGILALTTGGNIAAHNVYYDDSYDRSLWPPGTNCSNGTPEGPAGTETQYAENIDLDLTRLDGGKGSSVSAINPKKLPLDKSCKPVYPHSFLQVNTIFECVVNKGGFTAWADKHPAYDLLNGPSGKGVQDLFTPEINSAYLGSTNGSEWTTNALWTQQYDALHVNAALQWITGRTWTGNPASVPTLFGFNFQAVSVAQKLSGPMGTGGYYPNGTFQDSMRSAMQFVDTSVGSLVMALKYNGVYEKTAIIITAKHGQSPIDNSKLKKIAGDKINATLVSAGVTDVIFITQDDIAIIWLKDISQGNIDKAVKALQDQSGPLSIAEIIAGPELLKRGLAKSVDDPRAPQIVIKVVPGTIYSTSAKKVAEHGGLNDDDKRVGLLVSGGGIPKASTCPGSTVNEPVLTRQVAPTVLQLLGIDPTCLQAVQQQKTQVLPGLFSAAPGAKPCAQGQGQGDGRDNSKVPNNGRGSGEDGGHKL